MSVIIQEVLGLLPQLFPGVQKLPYSNIRPNPDNPGAPLSDQDIEDLADNLSDRGLVNPLKVQVDPLEPFALGVKPHADDPRLTAEGRPWVLADFNYRILAGERRFRASGRLGWAELPAFVLNPSAEEAVEITHLDNDVRDRGWWAGYQSIEQLVKANPSLTQGQVATKLKMERTKVNRALGLLPLLNLEAKALISANCTNSNKGKWGISEAAALRLTDLGPELTLKPGVRKAGDDSQKLWPYPAISPEVQDLVRRTLVLAVDKQMTETTVRGLVAWVQEGHQPEEYGAKPPAVSPKTKVQPQPPHTPCEVLSIPVARVRVNGFIAQHYSNDQGLQQRALSMQATGYATEIEIRPLSDKEKEADPNHDYELFIGEDTLKCAQMLGWPTLKAYVYAVDEDEAIKRFFIDLRFSTPLTWVEVYSGMEKALAQDPSLKAPEVAIRFMQSSFEAADLLSVMKLLNDNAKKMIVQNIHEHFEGRVDMGGYRFDKRAGLELKRLEGVSKNLAETQRLVERVVRVAVAQEENLADLKGLIDWVLEGNSPEDYFEKAVSAELN